MQQPLSDVLMGSMQKGRVFRDNSDLRINSLAFHRSEDLLVTAGEDDTLHVYNTASGMLQDTLLSRKYGCQCVTFTHHPNAVLYASNKGPDHTLRYLSLYDNRYLRYFKGHGGRVTSLCMSPKSDLFMSSAQDRQVRLWDLRTNICQGCLAVPGLPTATFDEQGLVFAVATESGVLKLYDVRSYDKGPFDTFTIQDEVKSPAAITHLSFSSDGKLMLAGVEGRSYLIDAFQGSILRRFGNATSEGGAAMSCCFSYDGQYVLSGCEDRSIRVWSTATHHEVAAWHGHAGVPQCIKWAPRRLLVASACHALSLWIPTLDFQQPAVPAVPVAPVYPGALPQAADPNVAYMMPQ